MSKKYFETVPIPPALAHRPRDSRGYPIPHSAWRHPETLEYDFRVVDEDKRKKAIELGLCGVSGLPLEPGNYWFIGGLVSLKNRLFVDPAMRQEVAYYSIQVCPHLALAASQYRTAGLDPSGDIKGASRDKTEYQVLASTGSYSTKEVNDYQYIVAGPWKLITIWKSGKMLSKEDTKPILENEGFQTK